MTFSLTDPLPTGTTVIEASAGTGKTYAIVGLAARYVADGFAELSQLMLVTFGRAATKELRDRARERFRDSARTLADPTAARGCDDEVIRSLATGSDEEVDVRRRRLLQAVSNFDAATIATTHSFCQRMLDGMGVAGDYQPDAVYRDNTADLLSEVSEDLYAADYTAAFPPVLTLREAKAVAKAAVEDPQASLVPIDAMPGSVAAQRVAFAAAARAELIRRKRGRGVRDFNDMLMLLRDALADPVHGRTACARIRARYRVVLVDEFQDTDPIQWEILHRAFHGMATMVLVGDPKQAIYGFRGADVQTYIAAVQVTGESAALAVNRRSDAPLLRALDRLYGGAALGDDAIVVNRVHAAHQDTRIPGDVPLRLRYLDRGGSSLRTVGDARARVAVDVADDIVAVLDSGAQFVDRGRPRPLVPSDIAVLVRSRHQGTLVCDALNRARIPCVLTGGSSVFATEAAGAWGRLLAALEQPHRRERIRLAALSPLLGYTAAELAADGDGSLAALSSRIRYWSNVFQQSGLVSMFELVAAECDLQARLLMVEGGERLLTDLRHLGQVLNRAVMTEGFGLAALVRWLAQRAEDESFTATADRSRLLDRDTDAVCVITIHASKGLEFPMVYLPFCWDCWKPDKPDTLLLHENGIRVRDVGGNAGPGHTARKTVHDLEEAGEELRLLYVAATRAQCRVVAWWAPTSNTRTSSLHRLLFGRVSGELHPVARPDIPVDGALSGLLADWATPAADVIRVEAVGAADHRIRSPQLVPPGQLVRAEFCRELDWGWRRTSYTRLTYAGHARAEIASETDEYGTVDEPGTVPPTAAAGSGSGTPSLMNMLPSGTGFGTLVHAVLQRIDTSAADLVSEVRVRCDEVSPGRLATDDVEKLAAALTAAMRTPLPVDTLADIAPADRLAELEFELPLAGGDETLNDGAATVCRIADLIGAHLPADDPLAGYPPVLRTLPDIALRGYLTGSIDAVLRYPGPRYVVVDYKTNSLFPGPVDAAWFNQTAMAAEMLRMHYPLQALLYSVALHRYLRWRQPGYQPDEHLGGVMYLFLRAMVGETTPPGCGVFSWDPPPALVVALSDLLAAK